MAENPDEPDGRRIDIHVARIPARGRVAQADPLVFFAGGPGQAATEAWPLLAHALRKVNESRDILLVDQRGTGQSNPLKCPEIELDEALAQDLMMAGRAPLQVLAGAAAAAGGTWQADLRWTGDPYGVAYAVATSKATVSRAWERASSADASISPACLMRVESLPPV